ncbi:MAG: hypothetical protein ACFFBV_16050, partial [Promethearchaeota archaeon]
MDMIGRISEKVGGSGIFLLSISIIYVTLGIIDIQVTRNAIWVLGGLILRIFPVLALVFGIMFLTNLLFEAEGIVRMLGGGSGLRGWIFAVLGGIISSGPIYMWYPLLGDLKEKGMRESLISAFLYNRAIKIPLVPMMVHYFGWPFAVILSL